MLFIAGTMLPDLLTRPVNEVMTSLTFFVLPMHTPVGFAVVCWGVSGLFKRGQRAVVFVSLFGGGALHFALDAMQRHVALPGAYFWLFPFSWTSYREGLFWPNTSLLLLPYMLAAVAAMEVVFYVRRRASSRAWERE